MLNSNTLYKNQFCLYPFIMTCNKRCVGEIDTK